MRLLTKENFNPGEFYQYLYECMIGGSIPSLLLLVESFWKVPVSVIDTHYNLIDIQPKISIGDPTYDHIIKTGRIPDEMIKSFIEGQYLMTIVKHEEPFEINWGVAKKNHRLAYRLMDNDVLYGVISLVLTDDCPWTDADSALLKPIAAAITQIMSRNSRGLESGNYTKEWLFSSLLKEKGLDKKSVLFLKENLDIHSQHYFRLIHLAPNEKSSPYHLNYLHRRLRLHFQNHPCTQLGGSLYLLLHDSTRDGLMNRIHQLETFIIADSNAVLGISKEFNDLGDTPRYRIQADFCYDYACQNGKSGIHFYEDFMLHHIFSLLSSHLPDHCYVPDSIRKLEAYDHANGTSYKETLHIYLEHFLDNKRTIQHFGIHRNTLLYRLNQIEQIAEISLTDSKTLTEMMIAFKIEEFSLGENTEPSFP